MLKEKELAKLASADASVRNALFTLAKLAAKDNDKSTEFDETVPAAEKTGPDEDKQNQQGPVPPKEAVPVGPIAQPIQEGPTGDPAVEGARAAQAFLQPAFDAAASGDPAAQKTVAMAAGEVARGVAEASATTGAEMPPEAAAVPPVSPEQAVADQIVAQPQAAPAAPPAAVPAGQIPPEQQVKQSSDNTYSIETVSKLVKMAKMGII